MKKIVFALLIVFTVISCSLFSKGGNPVTNTPTPATPSFNATGGDGIAEVGYPPSPSQTVPVIPVYAPHKQYS